MSKALISTAAVLCWCTFSPAMAHDWYPQRCCGGLDCQALPRDAVRWTPAGWLVLESGETIPEGEAQESPDGFFHRCRMIYDVPTSKTRMTGGKRCFWRPGAGS